MADIEGTRLEAQKIIRALPDKEVLNCEAAYALKAGFGLIIFTLGMWGGAELGIASWLKDCILWPVTIYIIFVPFNAEALRWLFSEWQRDLWAVAHHQPDSTGGELSAVPTTMKRGDYIRFVEDGIAANDQTASLTQRNTTQEALATSQQSELQGPQPQLTYYRVIAKLAEPDIGRVWIYLFGHEPLEGDPADSSSKYRRLKTPSPDDKTPSTAESASIAEALDDLIDLLSKSNGPIREKVLAEKLVNRFDHVSQSVRLALRIAEAGGLINRQTLGGRFAEQLKIFRRKAEMAGHESCEIKLSETGRMWELAESQYRKKEDSPGGVTMVNGDYHHVENNGGIVGSVGRGNKTEIKIKNSSWQSYSTSDAKALAKELEKLRTELRKQPTSPEQDAAIYDVASAVIEAEKGDGDGAMSKLAALGSRTDHVRKWVVDTATSIGIPLAVEAVKRFCLHIPPGA